MNYFWNFPYLLIHNDFYKLLWSILYFILESSMSDISKDNEKGLTNFSKADQVINV